ncbi:ABC transporter permease [Desulfosporosinus lacus]|nr:ABC transporter permease [Desulfosporosinus lacus]
MKKRVLWKWTEYLMTFLLIITLNFMIPRLMPGDPFTFLSAEEEGQVFISYSQEQIDKYKAYYGLDKPLPVQYGNYLVNLCRGDIGYSIYYNVSVLEMIGKRLLWTVGIVLGAILISTAAGTVMGCFSAWYRDSLLDKLLYFLMITISEIPAFLVGILLLFILAGQFGWFPLFGGMSSFAQYDTSLERAKDILHHAFLPVLTLSLTRVGGFYLLSRNSMLEVLAKDYMRTARAKGLARVRIIFRHALKNALLPVITRVFLSLGAMFGGAVLVENVFSYPGLGRLMREAVMLRDYVLIQGIFLFVAILVLTMNLLADTVYKKLDPRVNYYDG